jgi:magnesium transporter
MGIVRSVEMRESTAAQSTYAVGHVDGKVPIVDQGETVGNVVDSFAAYAFQAIDAVYVVDEWRQFRGAVSLADLFRAPREQPIGELVDASFPRVGPHHAPDYVAAQAFSRGVTSVAIVDTRGRLTGVVTARSLLEILRREHVEDLHRLAGITREPRQDHEALEGPPSRRARHRLPWLLVGLVGSMVAALLMARFERVLTQQVAIAFFVPAIVYLADAIGTQTEAIAVRGLSVSQLPLRRLLAGEIRTGLMIGATLAALSFPLVTVMFGDVRLGLSVALAVLVAGAVATTTGLILPWALLRFGSDPAFGSGPLATIIQDVLSIAIYFAIVTHVMT